MRTTQKTIIFDHPFLLTAVDRLQPAGTYTIDIDEEPIEGLSFLAYRRIATTIYLPLYEGNHASVQAVRVDPRELTAAHEALAARTWGSTASVVNGVVD